MVTKKRLPLAEKYGRLTTIGEFGQYARIGNQRVAKRCRMVKCRCECGNEITVRFTALNSGNTKSCGCLLKEVVGKRSRSHGKSRMLIYPVWMQMNVRCYNISHKYFYRYGGRGITVCDSWRESFENFYSDMGDRPSNKHSLDRIDNDKGYFKENCRWATRSVQQRNTSITTMVKFNGDKVALADLAEKNGIPNATLKQRLKRGWSLEEAAAIPLGIRIKKVRSQPSHKPAQ